MTTIQALRAVARRSGKQRCTHRPRCPGIMAHDRGAARTIASQPEQGWSLLCNGIVVFDDGGGLLPDGRPFPPPQTPARIPAAA